MAEIPEDKEKIKKGTGKLREGVHGFLQQHPQIDRFELYHVRMINHNKKDLLRLLGRGVIKSDTQS